MIGTETNTSVERISRDAARIQKASEAFGAGGSMQGSDGTHTSQSQNENEV